MSNKILRNYDMRNGERFSRKRCHAVTSLRRYVIKTTITRIDMDFHGFFATSKALPVWGGLGGAIKIANCEMRHGERFSRHAVTTLRCHVNLFHHLTIPPVDFSKLIV
jgi:hypothetical protein